MKKGLTYVGTIRGNKAQLPPEMKPHKDREDKSTIFGFKDQLTLVSHVPKANNAVNVLSTLHHDKEINPETQKPEIIHYYNSKKSGVDCLDHMISLTSSKRKTNRWTMVVFYDMIDISTSAGYVIWLANKPEWRSRMSTNPRKGYLLELSTSLIMPQVSLFQNHE